MDTATLPFTHQEQKLTYLGTLIGRGNGDTSAPSASERMRMRLGKVGYSMPNSDAHPRIPCKGRCGSSWTERGWNTVSNWGERYDYTCYECVADIAGKQRQGRLFQ